MAPGEPPQHDPRHPNRGAPRTGRGRAALVSAAPILAALVAAAGASALRLPAMARYLSTASYEDVYYVPPPAWLPLLSAGYDEALADLLWMRALVYYGTELGERQRARHVLDYVEAILALDPDFRNVYRWTATAGLYRAETPSREDALHTLDILERGAARFPFDGELAWSTGATLAYELPALVEDPEERRALRERAQPFLERAARLGAGPPWLAVTNATQLQRLGRTEQAIRHIEEVYALVRDEATREQLAAHLAALRDAAYAEAFEEAWRDVEARRAREYPYLDLPLYLLVGPRDEGATERALLGGRTLSGGLDPAGPQEE
jgi:hypothetical protein